MFSASSLFNMTAQELHDLRIVSEHDFLELVNKAQFSEAVFTMTAKVETYNQSPQLKFNIQDMDHLEWGEEGGRDHILVVKCAMTKVSRELMVGLKRCPDQSSNIVTIII